MPKSLIGTEQDLMIVRAYTFQGVTVIMEIDLVARKASMVSYIDAYGNKQKTYQHKSWKFAEREQKYMAGWLLILDAMKYAVEQTDKILEEAEDRDQAKFMELVVAADKILKKNGKP